MLSENSVLYHIMEYVIVSKFRLISGTEKRLWSDIISKESVQTILMRWRQRVTHSDVDEAGDVLISNISPFRMVLHKARRMKVMYSKNGGMKGASKASHFALMWIPSNIEDGMNEQEFNDFIDTMRESGYFVNKLNKESVYISGPSYGNDEDLGGGDQDSDEVW